MSMSIAHLLQAAEYLERREREAEHGYASTLPMPTDYNPSSVNERAQLSSSNNRKSQGNRSTHNELEKNRRAHMRHCLARLKEMVPVGSEGSRHTTLGLLTKAKAFIKALEEKDRKQLALREQLTREHRQLKKRLDRLRSLDAYRNSRGERTISECSSSTASTASTASSASPDEHDEVDVMNSDSDDHSLGSDAGSDGGLTVTTKKLSVMMDSL